MNTYQAYLKQTPNCIRTDMDSARREGFKFGCKLVRGAYIDQERSRAKTMQYDDPINGSHVETTKIYHQCLDEITKEACQIRKLGEIVLMVASHNEDTIRYAVSHLENKSICK